MNSTMNLTDYIRQWLKSEATHHKMFDKSVFSVSMQDNISDWIVCDCEIRKYELRINKNSIEYFKESYGSPSTFIYAADPQFFGKLEAILKRSCSKKSL